MVRQLRRNLYNSFFIMSSYTVNNSSSNSGEVLAALTGLCPVGIGASLIQETEYPKGTGWRISAGPIPQGGSKAAQVFALSALICKLMPSKRVPWMARAASIHSRTVALDSPVRLLLNFSKATWGTSTREAYQSGPTRDRIFFSDSS